jgi:dTDP-4-dehydrorhamnose reductase
MGGVVSVLVVGSSGQVAQSLVEAAGRSGAQIKAIGRPALDITSETAVVRAIAEARPSLVINAAAHTAVDLAESEPEQARAVNAVAPGWIAREAAKAGAPVIHISTDYVYDGAKPSPYLESDATAPLGVYGASKLEGERRVAAENPRHLILRTAWVHSPFGKNFVKTMLKLAAGRPEVGVVADQIGSPTYAPDMAEALLAIAARLGEGAQHWGVFHIAAPDEAVWADVAEAAFASSRKRGGPAASVKRITTAEYPTPAKRPANSRLNTDKLAAAYGVRLRAWREGVDACVERLLASGAV